MSASRMRINWFRLIVIVLGLYFIYLCVGQQNQLNAVSAEMNTTREQLEQLQQTNLALKEEINLLNDRRYIEKISREELGLVKPGEVPFIVSKEKQN